MEEPKELISDHIEGHDPHTVETKKVQNVKLATAIERQKPSLFTKRMFTVFSIVLAYIGAVLTSCSCATFCLSPHLILR